MIIDRINVRFPSGIIKNGMIEQLIDLVTGIYYANHDYIHAFLLAPRLLYILLRGIQRPIFEPAGNIRRFFITIFFHYYKNYKRNGIYYQLSSIPVYGVALHTAFRYNI